jgi:hypothetical protein
VYINRGAMRALRTILSVVVLAFHVGGSGPAGGARAHGGAGRGAAGIVQVGRPLDVVRERAERQARSRAVDSLVQAATALAMSARGVHTGEVDVDAISARTRSAARGPGAAWEIHYWSNGAVTARVSLPAAGKTDP